MAKVQKVYTREFKEQAVQLAQKSGSPLPRWHANWASRTPPFINGVRSWLNTAPKRFQAVGIKRPWSRENRRLKRELERVQQERDILKKVVSILRTGIQMKYQFIEQYKQEFPVVVMCRVLEASESGYYAWRKRPTCQRRREDAQLSTQIRQVFTSHQGRYGSPRLHASVERPRAKHLPQTGSSADA